ncbi:bifunctional 3'-5' exonuclease/DNA polymerase [Streptomyces botrytidirepellens]|uniref:DNA-directed DNA polymerase n=1 Tax=Streptomyces botrytidirepellens TaxID=2486417 RepID=A0A3M8VRQ4_9ACTN|nr:bifunctional 3'-5' exonuclease/DNA polymerase [Streptomyces botrytidirepellens]RNG18433.1 bifunctional 3'-5' exonuclease/DNA polymerase [Streptomyces botrytidirepellens]
MRWAAAETDDGGVRLCPLDASGKAAGPVVEVPAARGGIAEAVRSRPEADRWVWRSTAEVYPRLLAAGVRVERCYDVEAAEALLLGHEGRSGAPRSLAAAWARLRGLPVPEDPPVRAAQTQPSLFEPGPPPLPPGTDPLDALLAVYQAQLARTGAAEHPDRMRLLTTSESAGTLVAAEMRRAGVPWRTDRHRELLDELLGERYPGGLEPRRMAELADEVSRAFGEGVRVRPDLPADVIRAFARAGIALTSTRAWELKEIDHPAVEPLLRYKKLYRLHTAHGWSWLQSWVRDGRFRPEYLPGGTVSGRWTTHGGGALQIPRVVRRAVVADPGWRLVVADADQMEPRVLAAISRDRGLMEVAGTGRDLYAELSDRAFAGRRDQAKLALLGAVYGQTSGDGLKHLAALRRRFPAAVAYVDDAARAGEEGRLVRTWLGRTCPPAGGAATDPADEAGLPRDLDEEPRYGTTPSARARGRFTRNFVVQGSAADWAVLMLAALRRALAAAGLRAELVFFQHDEVIVHCPEPEVAAVRQAIAEAGEAAGTIAFGTTPVRFPLTVAAVECYADAKD